MYFLLSLILIGTGITMILFPGFWFELTESWKSTAPSEPSGMYVFSIRFGGVMCALAGIAYIVVTLLGL